MDISLVDCSDVTLAKRRKMSSPNSEVVDESDKLRIQLEKQYSLENMQFVRVLRSDMESRRIILHTKLITLPADLGDNKDAIVILQKSIIPSDGTSIKEFGVVIADSQNECHQSHAICHSNLWRLKEVLQNDVYHRFEALTSVECLNNIDLTVIHPAEKHHFAKFTSGNTTIYHETPEVYHEVIVPFLAKKPRDLSWIDNIFAGSAERDRVIFSDVDPINGFTLVLDYQWNGRCLTGMHCLGLIRQSSLTCLRDLHASHIPMLKRLLLEGKKRLVERYCNGIDVKVNKLDDLNNTETNASDDERIQTNCDEAKSASCLAEDQIMAFFHYPPTFYRLHVHFKHVDSGDNRGMRAGRAHLLEEVIRNLELDGDFYAKRTLTVYLQNGGPMHSELFPNGNKNNVAA